jgi:GT2 family glycosyltransferase
MFHSLVICTKNRPSELLRLINELASMSPAFNEVVIIDSSEQGKALDLPVNVGTTPILAINVEVNLAQARNIGIRLINNECQIVHFVDDDVSFSPDYLLNVNIFFENNPSASAVTGLDQNLAAQKSLKIRLIRLYCDITKSKGIFSRFGFNFGNYKPGSIYKVDWMPGCNMIVRSNVLQSVKFTETDNLTFCEDLVFGLDLTRNFEAYFCHDILYTHHLSPLNRSFSKYKKLESARYNLTFLLSNYPRHINSFIIKIRLTIITLKINVIELKYRLLRYSDKFKDIP